MRPPAGDVYAVKSRDLRPDPCGTPESHREVSDDCWPSLTNWYLQVR